MRRIGLAVVLALVLFTPSPAAAQDVRDVFRRVNASVVIIHAAWQEQTVRGRTTRVREVGSGFLVSREGRVITTSHVVQTADSVIVEFLDGEQIEATVVASEPEADVSLLQLVRSSRTEMNTVDEPCGDERATAGKTFD